MPTLPQLEPEPFPHMTAEKFPAFSLKAETKHEFRAGEEELPETASL